MMNVNVFCKLTSSRLVCAGNFVVITDAGFGFTHMVELHANQTVVTLRMNGAAIKQRTIKDTRQEACSVVRAARVGRHVMLNAAGLVSIKLERRLGMASPQFDVTMEQATEATAAFCGVDLMQSNSESATSLLSNGVHLMYYDHVVHIVRNQITRGVSTRGGAWQPTLHGTLLVNCSCPDTVIADLCHTAFAIGASHF